MSNPFNRLWLNILWSWPSLYGMYQIQFTLVLKILFQCPSMMATLSLAGHPLGHSVRLIEVGWIESSLFFSRRSCSNLHCPLCFPSMLVNLSLIEHNLDYSVRWTDLTSQRIQCTLILKILFQSSLSILSSMMANLGLIGYMLDHSTMWLEAMY